MCLEKNPLYVYKATSERKKFILPSTTYMERVLAGVLIILHLGMIFHILHGATVHCNVRKSHVLDIIVKQMFVVHALTLPYLLFILIL
jgi:hypothetical protein